MKITGAQSFLLTTPVGGEIADSMQSVTSLEIVGLTIGTDTGLTGTGYTITVGHGGRVIQTALDTLFVGDLTGRDPHDVRQIWSDLYYGKSHWIGPMLRGPPQPLMTFADIPSALVPVSSDSTYRSLKAMPRLSALAIAAIDGLLANSPPSAQNPSEALVGL